MLGTSFGSRGDQRDGIVSILDKHRLAEMSEIEFERRADEFISMLPDRQEGKAAVVGYITAAIADLDEHIELLDARAERDCLLALQNARIDKTVEGQRHRGYEKQHEGSYYAALKQFNASQNPKHPG